MAESKFAALVDGLELSLSNQDSSIQVVALALDRISSDPDNPRKYFDPEALKDLAASMKERGILQPIIVRPAEEGRFIIRYGDRRFRAATQLGWPTIPAIISETASDENDIVDQVIENDQRVDLTAAELASAVKRLVEGGMKQAEIAKKLGRPKPLISMYAAVATMPPLLADLTGTLAIRTVYELFQAWKLDEARVEKLIAERAGDGITTAEARALVKDIEDRAAKADESLSKQTPEAVPGEPVAEAPTKVGVTRSKAKAKPEPLAPIFVDVGGRRGRIVLPAVVEILFEGEDTPASHKLDELRPVRD